MVRVFLRVEILVLTESSVGHSGKIFSVKAFFNFLFLVIGDKPLSRSLLSDIDAKAKEAGWLSFRLCVQI